MDKSNGESMMIQDYVDAPLETHNTSKKVYEDGSSAERINSKIKSKGSSGYFGKKLALEKNIKSRQLR